VNIEVAFDETFVFNPANVTAPNGTVVTFFFPAAGLSHSATQSSFAEPCTYLAANSSTGSSGGFDSGLQQGVQFSITIENDQEPIWFHCKQVDHCGMGMVGSINAPTTGNTFAAFQAAAQAIGSNEVTETDNGPVTGGVNAVASATPANTVSAAAAASSSSSSSSGATRVIASSGIVGLLSVAVSMIFFA